MAYTITLTDGSTLTTIADGTVNSTSSDLVLVGKNYAGYGSFLNENFVHLLENFSDSSAPTTPLTGQLWWDTAGNLKVYTGTSFKTLSSITSSTTQPSTGVTGNSWWDTVNEQFYVYNGSAWTLVGPAFSSNAGTSGTTVGSITDTGNVTHVAVNVFVASELVAIVSKDTTPYTPQTSITGFTTIKPGFNLVANTVIPNVAYYGTADNANQLGFVSSTNYARTDVAETFDNTVNINNNSGLTIGTSNNYTQSISSSVVQLTNNINNANLAIRANVGGLISTAMLIVGSTGQTQFSANVTAPNFIGNAVTALYADLAERFLADQDYPAGTVVMIGGEKEITQCDIENCENVLGVISTEPAYLMNSLNGGAELKIAPPVAMVGRVPVRTVGRVQKGDRLVSAGNGCAMAADQSSTAVIGRALESKETESESLVEAVVKVNI